MRNTPSPALFAGLLATSLALPAYSQSSVTVYGVADVFLQYGKGDATGWSLQSGGLSGSRLGFRGTEDLGGGLKALFRLEHGIALDNGTVTQGGVFWGRQAFVGLESSAGTLTLGRQYAPHFVTADSLDPFATGAGSGFSSGVMSLIAVRVNNAIAYTAPKFGDVSAYLLGGLGETTGGARSNNNSYGADIHYAPGKLDIGLGLGRTNRPTDAGVNASVALLAASYDFTVAKIFVGGQRVKNPGRVRGVRDDRIEYYGGVHVPVATGALWAAGYTGKTKDVSNTRATQWSLGFDQPLSKRTDLYVVGTTISNPSSNRPDFAGPLTADAATGAGPVVTVAGKDVKALQMGMRHRF